MNRKNKSVTLSDCLALTIDNRGKTPKKLNTDWKDEGYRTLSANNVDFSGEIKIDTIRKVDEKTYKKWMSNEIKRGDLLLTSEAPAGRVMYWDTDEKIVVGQRLFCLRTNEIADSKYLKYYLQSKTGQFEIYKNSSGSTVFGISAKMFDQISVLLPELKSQKKISSLLYSLDKKIEINNKIHKSLSDLTELVYNYWFFQFNFPNSQGKPYAESGGMMRWSEELSQNIPVDWEVSSLGKHIKIERGISYRSDQINDRGNPMISLNSFHLNGEYKPEGIKYFSGGYQVKNLVIENDLLVAVTDVTREADIIGKSFLVPDIYEKEIVMSCDVLKIVPKPELSTTALSAIAITRAAERPRTTITCSPRFPSGILLPSVGSLSSRSPTPMKTMGVR